MILDQLVSRHERPMPSNISCLALLGLTVHRRGQGV